MYTNPPPPFGNSESDTSQQLIQNARFFRCTLFRNNSGACKDETGRVIRYGLGHISPNQQIKSSDWIGITEVVITQEMVGRTLGVFTAFETKKRDWKPTKKFDEREIKQNNFLQFIISKGGIAHFVNDPTVDNLKNLFRQ
jgi:hypothetical protein